MTPRAGSSVAAGSDIAVKASSVDTTVSNISVWANGSLIGTGSSVPFSFTWRSVPAGSYSLTVRATGSDGVQRTSAPIAITVTGTGNTPPQVALTAPAQGAIYSSGSNVFPTATASDPDVGGSVARVEFWADGAKLGEDTTAPYAFTWVGPAVGTHVLTAVAYDNLGASATSSPVTITVTGTATNTPPTVALTGPATGASYTVGANIAMSATAADADVGGSIARVEFWSNGAKLGEDTTSPYAFTWIAPPVGSYSLTAKAFDNVGASTVSAPPVTVTVNNIVSGGQTVTLQDGVNGYSGGRDTYLYEYHNTTNFGAQTYLQDKNTVSRFRSLVRFAIFQAEGGPVPNGATITSAKLSLYKYSAYDTVFRLRPLLVNWVEGEATWQVRSAGVAWNAAGATGAGTDLAASYDAETAAVWNPGWVDFDVTTGVGAISAGRTNNGWLLDAVSGNSNIKQFYSGEYAIDATLRPKLVISYTSGGTGNSPPTVSLTAPAANTVFAAGASIGLAANASDPDVGGSVARVEFWADGGKLGEDLSAPYAFTWNSPASGTHVLTAVAVDNLGASTTSTSVTVTVSAPNSPPTVALTAPAANSTFVFGSSIGLAATASDPDVGGSVARVEFWANGSKLGEDLTVPYAFTWSAPPVGTQVLTAVAVDNLGAATTSASVSVTVTSATGSATVTLQDGVGGYSGTRDTYLYEFHAAINFGTKTFLEDKATTSRFRSMVRFAVFTSEGGPVPDGATIVSATLSLYKFSSYDYIYRLRPLLTNWVEAQATWQLSRTGVPWGAAGATGVGTDLATTYDAQASAVWNPGWVVFDVTNGIQAMATGRTNYGWLLEPVSGNSNLKEFQSREYTKDPTLRPKLVITYQN